MVGHSLLSPALRITHGASGLQVVARRQLEAGSTLVRIPAPLTVSADAAIGATPPGLLSLSTEAHVSIAIWLLHAAAGSAGEHDGDSRAAPFHEAYARALEAEADVDCTLLWDEHELALLQTSRAAARARALQAWADEEWQRISALPEAPLGPLWNVSATRFRWALCAVWSRSFQMRCEDDECGGAAGTSGGVWRVLAPGACLLNHDPLHAAAALRVRAQDARPERWHTGSTARASAAGASTAGLANLTAGASTAAAATAAAAEASVGGWRTEAEAEGVDAFELVSARSIDEGEEVTLDYGARSNSELLTTHGFALASNPAESQPM